MKRIRADLWLVGIAVALAAGCASPAERDVLYQVSTLDALAEGAYDGHVTISELRRHGDFGIGTFDALDGEMVVLDGRVYQIRADGKAQRAGSETTTPFAEVTFFEADHTGSIEGPFDREELERLLDHLLPAENVFYAIKIEGTFAYVKTRSVPKQTKPYSRLAEATQGQPTFEFENVRGTMVGFRCPPGAGGGEGGGWHLHFITADRTAGGHVLELRIEKVRIEIDYTYGLRVVLPRGTDFPESEPAAPKGAEAPPPAMK